MGTIYSIPQGSKDPIDGVLGPKYYRMTGVWDLTPYCLAPWTLREKTCTHMYVGT